MDQALPRSPHHGPARCPRYGERGLSIDTSTPGLTTRKFDRKFRRQIAHGILGNIGNIGRIYPRNEEFWEGWVIPVYPRVGGQPGGMGPPAGPTLGQTQRCDRRCWLWHHARRQASLPVAADLHAWRSSPRRPHALPGETPGRRSFAPDSFCPPIWSTSRCGADHRQDGGADRLGKIGPGGHDGVAQLPCSLISSNSSASHCLGMFARTISISRCLHSSASRFHTPMMNSKSGSDVVSRWENRSFFVANPLLPLELRQTWFGHSNRPNSIGWHNDQHNNIAGWMHSPGSIGLVGWLLEPAS